MPSALHRRHANPGTNPLGGYGKGVDRVPADRGQACRQTGCGETGGRLLPDPGDQLLPGLLHPIPDDGVSEHPDPGGCHGGGVRYEAAGEAVTQVRREQSEELRDGVGVAANDEPLRPGADGLSEDAGGVVKVMVGEFGDPLVRGAAEPVPQGMIVISAWRQALMTRLVRPGRRSALLRSAGAVLYQRVGGWHEHALVTVLPPDQIRRRAILPVNLHDHALAVHVTHVPAPDQQLITCNRAHRHPSSASMSRRSRRCFRRNRAKGPRYWILDMHVDRFRFDLASALARELHDVDRLAALFNLVQQDPVISQVKLIAEPWDGGEGGYQVGRFPPL